jgi:hypothetical protein
VRVPDPRQRLGLAAQAIDRLPVSRRWQDLHGDMTLEAVLACQPDLAHPTGAERTKEFEPPQTQPRPIFLHPRIISARARPWQEAWEACSTVPLRRHRGATTGCDPNAWSYREIVRGAAGMPRAMRTSMTTRRVSNASMPSPGQDDVLSPSRNATQRNTKGNPTMQQQDPPAETTILALSTAPGPSRNAPLTESDPLLWILSTMRQNAPILSFHPDENYLTYNVPDYLQNVQLYDSQGKLLAQPPLTPQRLPIGPASEATYLAIPADRHNIEAGDLKKTQIYCHALYWTHGEFSGADFQYFFFYPYNGKGFINIRFPGISQNDIEIPAGAHQGDWESIIVRTDSRGSVLGIYCNQHGSGQWYLPGQIQWRGEHPVIYVARSGHPSFNAIGHFPTHGGDFTVSIAGYTIGVQLDNVTGAGAQLSTSEVVELVSTSYFDGVHVEEPWWLHYLGRFGLVVFNERDKQETTSIISRVLSHVMPHTVAKYLADLITNKIYSILGEIEPDGPEPPRAKGWWNEIRQDGPWTNISRRWSGNQKISSLPGHINPLTRDNIGLAAFGSKLCMAFRAESSNVLYQAWYDGTSWTGNKPITVVDNPNSGTLSTRGPALARYDDRLYAAFKASDSNRLFFTWYDGTSWKGNIPVRTDHGFAESTAPPALCSYQGQLFMAFKAADPSNHLYLCRFDGTSWTGNQVIQTDHGMPSSSDSPTLALYNGALIMTFKANDASNELYAARYDGANWTGNQPIQTDHGTAVSPLSPWMVSLDGELMMLFKGNDSDYIYLAALLSSGWHGNERLSRTTPISPMTNASGAIAALGKRRIMVFKAADSTQIYQAECLDSL